MQEVRAALHSLRANNLNITALVKCFNDFAVPARNKKGFILIFIVSSFMLPYPIFIAIVRERERAVYIRRSRRYLFEMIYALGLM